MLCVIRVILIAVCSVMCIAYGMLCVKGCELCVVVVYCLWYVVCCM